MTPAGVVVRAGLDLAWAVGVAVALASLLLGGCASAGSSGACSTWSTARAAACAICALPSCGEPAEVGAEGDGGEVDVFTAPSPEASPAGECDVSRSTSDDVSRGPQGDVSRGPGADTSAPAARDTSLLQTLRLRLRVATRAATGRGERLSGVPVRWHGPPRGGA